VKIKTEDLSIFKKAEGNRDIDPANLKKIVNSIKINNMLELRPLTVNKNMEVLDGQHRLEAAKVLGLPVYYEINVDATPEDMILLNTAQKGWSMDDYVKFYASRGDENYIRVLDLAKKYDCSAASIISLSGKGYSTGEGTRRALKNGRLKFDFLEAEDKIKEKMWQYNQVADFIKSRTFEGVNYTGRITFKRALFVLFDNPEFVFSTFMHKLQINISKMHSCTMMSQYVQLLKEIYNYKNENPIP
jgi:hypothetical protein